MSGDESMSNVSIVRVLPADSFDPTELVAAARAEGYNFVERAVAAWRSGENRFQAPGEGMFLAIAAGPVGMAGVNVDPYLDDPAVGRLRHLYVLPAHRRSGVGRQLVRSCLQLAGGSFERVRLRTFEARAARFYEAIGFQPVSEPEATHSLDL